MKYGFKCGFVASLLFCLNAFAEDSNLLAISQGISSPNQTSTINYSKGFTHENPVGVIYQNNIRLTGEYDTGEDSQGKDSGSYGAEFGAGNGKMGFALGYSKVRDCDSCEGKTAGAAAFAFDSLAFGIRFQEDFSTLGLLLNPAGTHRFGLVAELDETSGANTSITKYGLGYSYFTKDFTFTLDASKRDYKDKTVKDDLILFTPGVALRVQKLEFMVSKEVSVNVPSGTKEDDDLYWGIGYGSGSDFHIALYSDYVNKWAIAASFFF